MADCPDRSSVHRVDMPAVVTTTAALLVPLKVIDTVMEMAGRPPTPDGLEMVVGVLGILEQEHPKH